VAAVTAFGAPQLVPGSDWPILLRWETYQQTFAHIRQGGLSEADVAMILHRNVQTLLGPAITRGAALHRAMARA
jgi:aminocarboxymuconate-semialdehyde decarboxylase